MFTQSDIQTLRGNGTSDREILEMTAKVVPQAYKALQAMDADTTTSDLQKTAIMRQMIDKNAKSSGRSMLPYISALTLNSATKKHDNLVVEQEKESTSLGGKLAARSTSVFGNKFGPLSAVLDPAGTMQSNSAVGRLMRGEQGLEETVYQGAGAAAGGINDVIGSALGTAGKVVSAVTPDFIEKPVTETASEFGKFVASSPVGKTVGDAIGGIVSFYNNLKETDPRMAANLASAVNITSLLPLPPIGRGVETIGEGALRGATNVAEKLPVVGNMLKKEATSQVLEQGAKQTDAALMRAAAEQAKPDIGILEKVAGVRPDIKNRIMGKSEKLQEFFDVSHARNLSDTAPTPLEYGARDVENARTSLQKVMNDTGGKIGQFREKIATLQVGIDDMKSIEQSFVDSIVPLNVTVKNGAITRIPGKVAGKVSDTEINHLQSVYDDLLRVKSAPSSANLIDLRNAVQDRINFAKTAKEASSVLDPVARNVRSKIRDVNLKMVGKEQGSLLDEYSNMASLLEELNKVTDSKAGAEFLLKRVLSERGRVPREIMQKLFEYTGIDLMDTATMAQLATEIVGNPAQKSLFQNEIQKAGLSIVDIVTGSKLRSAVKLLQMGSDKIAPAEKMFMKAAKSTPKAK